ncbi:hypothetical protein QAD02_019830 [Eretmocerus hayati]|uniref:Uncharacterized protein n=1 Tax=Eretmocerus hayati TaxID=131215 RepID=A0ACC2PKR5_9HYME|nr:hypothetical protein QAD02_019830 [Eretmocerus hayati]
MSSDDSFAFKDDFPVPDSALDTDAIISSAIAEFNEVVQYPELTSRLAGEPLGLQFFGENTSEVEAPLELLIDDLPPVLNSTTTDPLICMDSSRDVPLTDNNVSLASVLASYHEPFESPLFAHVPSSACDDPAACGPVTLTDLDSANHKGLVHSSSYAPTHREVSIALPVNQVKRTAGLIKRSRNTRKKMAGSSSNADGTSVNVKRRPKGAKTTRNVASSTQTSGDLERLADPNVGVSVEPMDVEACQGSDRYDFCYDPIVARLTKTLSKIKSTRRRPYARLPSMFDRVGRLCLQLMRIQHDLSVGGGSPHYIHGCCLLCGITALITTELPARLLCRKCL